MKIGIVGDIHFSEYSSILRSRGEKYSTRLENCIDSISWVEEILNDKVEEIVYLGDFFDKSSLNAEELTAVSSIKWNNIHHTFLVGNHEMGINDLTFSSAHLFKFDSMNLFKFTDSNGFTVADSAYCLDLGDIELCYLPYILEEDRNSLEEYFSKKTNKKRVIFSHNDIAGIQMGQFISKAGFSIEEIEDNCDLFFNGHLHNGMPITNKIINVGNLTGQNFSEDGFKYSHNIFILDTDTLTYDIIRNPYAINFYKIENIEDLNRVNNAVVTVKAKPEEAVQLREKLENDSNIIASRLIIDYSNRDNVSDVDNVTLAINHLDEFSKFAQRELSGQVDSDLMMEELSFIYG